MKIFNLRLDIITFAIIASIAFYACSQPSSDTQAASIGEPQSNKISETETAINQAVTNAYARLSFEKGSTPDYEALRSVFTPDAVFMNYRSGKLERLVLDDFINMIQGMIASGQVASFYEEELEGKTEYFGKIGHRLSSYVTYINTRDAIAERGVNSFQLIKIDGKWLINSIIWDVEREGQPIPTIQ